MVCRSICQEEDSIWYIDIILNSLVCESDNEKEIIGDIFGGKSYTDCCKWEKSIICISKTNGTPLIVYDIVNGEVREIKYSSDYSSNIVAYWIYNDTLWVLAKNRNLLFEINIRKEIVEGVYLLKSEYEIGESPDKVDNIIYIPCRNSTNIIKFDIKTHEIEYLAVKSEEKGYNTVSVYNSSVYLTGTELGIYKFDFSDNTFNKIDFNTNKIKRYGTEFYIRRSIINNKTLFLVPKTEPEKSNAIVIFDIESTDLFYVDVLEDVFKSEKSWGNRFVDILFFYDDALGIYMDCLPLHKYYYNTNEIYIIKDVSKKIHYGKNFINNPCVLMESSEHTLDSFVSEFVMK